MCLLGRQQKPFATQNEVRLGNAVGCHSQFMRVHVDERPLNTLIFGKSLRGTCDP